MFVYLGFKVYAIIKSVYKNTLESVSSNMYVFYLNVCVDSDMFVYLGFNVCKITTNVCKIYCMVCCKPHGLWNK